MTQLEVRQGRVGYIQNWLWNRKPFRLGHWGEWITLGYLLRKRWDILARNWRIPSGEIDVIARCPSALVFVEVKTRKGPTLFSPEEAVDPRKRAQLERLALRFLIENRIVAEPIRFDLVAIETRDRRSFTLRHYRGFM